MTSISILLAALVTVETGHLPVRQRDHAVGKAGERSAFQIRMTPEWGDYAAPGERPERRRDARQVATRILKDRFEWFSEMQAGSKVKQPLTHAAIYALWCKPTLFAERGFRVERLPKRVRERCERYANVVADLERSQRR